MYTYTAYSDGELVGFLQQGDESAFTELYNRYWEILFAIGYNFSKDKEMAREIVQEVFMKLWEHRADTIINNPGGWLATAIKFSVFKQIQRTKRRQDLLQKTATPIVTLHGEDVTDAIFLREYINGEVEKLPEKCRLVFRYSREQGMTIPEIAQQMNISPKTVENHLTKALAALRHSLKDAYILLPLLLTYLDSGS